MADKVTCTRVVSEFVQDDAVSREIAGYLTVSGAAESVPYREVKYILGMEYFDRYAERKPRMVELYAALYNIGASSKFREIVKEDKSVENRLFELKDMVEEMLVGLELELAGYRALADMYVRA